MAQRRRHKRTQPLKRAETEIVEIGARGEGVCLVRGERIYVPYTAPNDVVEIEYAGDRGRVVELISESHQRAAAPCRYFGQCGGCVLQHLNFEPYKHWKWALVVTALAREGFDGGLVEPVIACPPASRRRVVFAVRRTKAGVTFGFNTRTSNEIVAIRTCTVLAPALADALVHLRALAAAAPIAWRAFDVSATLCANGVDVRFAGSSSSDISIDDLDAVDFERLSNVANTAGILRLSINSDIVVVREDPRICFGSVCFSPPPGVFLQPSREGEKALIDLVVENFDGAVRLADLFSGCGTFSLPLSMGAQVDAYDDDKAAVEALTATARDPVIGNRLKAHRRNLLDNPLTEQELSSYDGVIFDPPRAGARRQAVEIANCAAPLVIGVSCNPSTFTRDAAILRDGGYQLTRVVPVDQFVFSPHIEVVGVFKRPPG